MIYDAVDLAFRAFMWMLLDPVGRNSFMLLLSIVFVSCTTYLIYDFRRFDELEKTGRLGNTRSQQESSSSKDQGSSRSDLRS